MFVCGAETTFKGDEKYVIDGMGYFETIEEAVRERKGLHSSFSYAIYEVEPKEKQGLVRSVGFRSGTKCAGHKLIRKVCNAYDHPAWEGA